MVNRLSVKVSAPRMASGCFVSGSFDCPRSMTPSLLLGEVFQQPVRVQAVKGITKRGVWIRVYHAVYEVETNLGPAYMYPPNDEHMARIVMKTEGSMSPGRMVKVPKALWSRIDELKLNNFT